MTVLNQALLITAIGMSLVFVAIILLWGLMELIVTVTKDKEKPEDEVVEEEVWEETPASLPAGSRQAQAAAVAVGAALNLSQTRPNALKAALAAVSAGLALQRSKAEPTQQQLPGSLPSPWQGALRARQMADNARILRRK